MTEHCYETVNEFRQFDELCDSAQPEAGGSLRFEVYHPTYAEVLQELRCLMSVRYLSAQQTIAAAGAVFACPDDDFSDLARARLAARQAGILRLVMLRLSAMIGRRFANRTA